MPESFSTINQQKHHSGVKSMFGIGVSLLLPPVGILLAIWLLLKGRKLNQAYLVKAGLAMMVTALIGTIGYGTYIYIQMKDNTGPIVARPSDYSQDTLVVCIDKKQTLVISKISPYKFDTGGNEGSGSISVTLARHFLAKTNGDFVIGVGPNKGNHHFDEGKCPNT